MTHKKSNIILTVVLSCLLCSKNSFAIGVETNNLEYTINDTPLLAENTKYSKQHPKDYILKEEKSLHKKYSFNKKIHYLLKYQNYDKDSCLNKYQISWDASHDTGVISYRAGYSFIDILNQSKNIQQLTENNNEINNHQILNCNKLFCLLDKIQQKKESIFIPDIVLMAIEWNKTYVIHPVVTITELKEVNPDSNEIIFNFKLLNQVDLEDFSEPEEREYLLDIEDYYECIIFEIYGSCKINFQTNQKEVIFYTKSGEELMHFTAQINDEYLSEYSINNMQKHVLFTIKNKAVIEYQLDKNKGISTCQNVSFLKNYTLIENTTASAKMLSKIYDIYKKDFRLSSKKPYKIAQISSLQNICNQIIENDGNTQGSNLVSLLLEIKENNYRLFIPDLIPIINQWYKMNIIDPFVNIDDVLFVDSTNEVHIKFNIKQSVNTLPFMYPDEKQFLLSNSHHVHTISSRSIFEINGICKINLKTKKRTTMLFDKIGNTILQSNLL